MLRLLATEVLLAQDPTPAPGESGTGAEFGKAAPIGLVLVLLLFLATILLIRSMNRHVRTLPTSFADPDAPPPPGDQGSSRG